MKTSIKLLTVACLAMTMQSCYESYKFDHEYTATYFSRNTPVRTLVEDVASDKLTFTFGACLSGKYDNDQEWNVTYQVDPTYLSDSTHLYTATDKVLLPEDYYTLSNPTNIVIPAGEILGEVKVSIDKEKFMNDPLGYTGRYVLPLKMTATDADSILSNLSYTLIAVKYVTEHDGHYYIKGQDKNNAIADSTSTVVYSSEDLVSNRRMELTCSSKNLLNVPYVGRYNTTGTYMTINIADDNTVTFTDNTSDNVSNISGTGKFDAETKGMTLQYNYNDANGDAHTVNDTLVFSKLQLSVEEWN